jgi:hypothetical protein
MDKGGNELARGRIPELGGSIPARREDPSTIRAKSHVGSVKLIGKGGEQLS